MMSKDQMRDMAKCICRHLMEKSGDNLYCRNCSEDNIPCGFSLDIAKCLIMNGYSNVYDIEDMIREYSNNMQMCVVERSFYNPTQKIETQSEITDGRPIF